MQIDVQDLLLDDVNLEKMHSHGISMAVAFEVLDHAPRALPNHAEDGAPVLLVGPTSIGFVSLPVDPTGEYGTWRPRTGYPSSPADVARYQKLGRT